MDSSAGASGSHWLKMAAKCTLGSLLRESRALIFNCMLDTIFSIRSLFLCACACVCVCACACVPVYEEGLLNGSISALYTQCIQ